MRIISILVVVLYLVYRGDAYTSQTRLEKDYDYDGAGESYYLKTYVDGEYRLVCWIDEYWTDWQYWEKAMSRWCEPFFMTFGSPYTGTDYPGAVDLQLDCVEDSTDPGDCQVLKMERKNCTYHVRIQCMDPMSDFDRAQPLSGILMGVCIALGVVLVISWIGCCCVCCCKKSSSTGKSGTVYAQPQQRQQYTVTQQQQQQSQQQQYAPTQAYAPPPAQQQPQPGYMQQPPPQALYPPPNPAYPPGSQPTAPESQASDVPPPYGAVTGTEKM